MQNVRYFLLALLLSLTQWTIASNDLFSVNPLSEKSYVSILTCDPGKELYSTFGHSAIGVFDPAQKLLVVFNYGTFDFNVPHFYLKFASGKLLYKLSAGNYWRFLVEYETEERRVTEQQLNLTLQQRQRLFNLLLENYKPENREYQYDFFFDNCASRILDMLYSTLGDTLVYQSDQQTQPTFRNLIEPYLVKSPWSQFGIDIALGSIIDKPATPRQQAFLPDLLKDYFDHCQINGEAFVLVERQLVPPSPGWPSLSLWKSPLFICWMLFCIVLVGSYWLRKRNWNLADRFIYSTFGLIGIFVLLLWFATDHDATAGNLNILWANPLLLILVFQSGKEKVFWVSRLQIILIALYTAVVLGWYWIPQQFNQAFLPLLGIVLIRLIANTDMIWLKEMMGKK